MWDCFLRLLSRLHHQSLESSYLSDDLIIHEILTRLPVKSILRFKSVSKLWYSALSSSKFASLHLTKFPLFRPSASVNTLFIESYKDCYLYSYDDDDQISGNYKDKLVKLGDDFRVKNLHKFTGCCNGLICLSQLSGEYFFLWNPATRKLHKYPSDGYLPGIYFDYSIATGFGYVSSHDDYKYVRILTLSWESEQASNIVHIFSLRENKWKKIEFYHDIVNLYGKPLLFNEKLYWNSCSKHIVGPVIVCFDLVLEKFDIIKSSLIRFSYLGLMGARLSESKYNSTDRGDELKTQILGSNIIETIFYIHLPKEIVLVDSDSDMIGYTRTGNFFVTGKANDDVVERRRYGCKFFVMRRSSDVAGTRRLWRRTLWLVRNLCNAQGF